jgi:hypothetical protein
MSTTFSGVLTALAAPLAKKVLAALGMGVVSYAAITAALAAVTSAVTSAYGAITGDLAAILSLAGFGQALGIILGAMASRLTFAQLNKLQVLAK